ncbi:MAG: hypothetical protein BHV88_17025 [Clostridiales bacterium 41_12_two_minus]|nr:MAG: hypothetical protein BHV88_17025 [Clostridiales bacterium 41_12_two_minus]
MANFDISGARFNEQLRMLETTDPVHADLMNAMFGQLIKNDVAMRDAVSVFAKSKNEQALFLLNLRRTGKRYGVHFDAYSVSPASTGTRLYDAVGKVATPSTDSVRGINDFEGESVFYGLEVNGYVDTDGEFVVQYIKGIDNEFSRTDEDKDVYMLYLTQWIQMEVTATGENIILSDENHPGSFPEGAAIRPDGTVRPFVPIAKYMAWDDESGIPHSVSGKTVNHNQSHNNMITRFRKKGNQYCGTTAQDKAHLDNLFMVAFATRHTQSIMTGCTSYYYQYKASVQEADVERIIIAKSQAANLVVGSIVSIGNATTLSEGSPNIERGNSGMHAKANRVVITAIEDYDESNSAVYVDNGGTKFSTASTMINGSVESPTYISTMPWKTGACDNVLGSCGSPVSNTNSKYPYILFGVEMFLGFWEIISNVILKITSHVMVPYICYDCTKLATSVTEDYKAVGYSVVNTQATYKYISKLGYDPDNPCVRHAVEVNATSSTGYGDGHYTENLDEASDATREWLSGGYLSSGAPAGRFRAALGGALSLAYWGYAARLSASGRCAQSAA